MIFIYHLYTLYVLNGIIILITDVIDYHFETDNVARSVHAAFITVEYVHWRCT